MARPAGQSARRGRRAARDGHPDPAAAPTGYAPSDMPPPPAMDVPALQEFLDAAFPADLPYVVEEVSDTGVRMRLTVGESNVRPGGTVSGP